MRRFSRGGYRDLPDQVQLVVRDEVVGLFVPTASVHPLPSATPSSSSVAPVGSVGGSFNPVPKPSRRR